MAVKAKHHEAGKPRPKTPPLCIGWQLVWNKIYQISWANSRVKQKKNTIFFLFLLQSFSLFFQPPKYNNFLFNSEIFGHFPSAMNTQYRY